MVRIMSFYGEAGYLNMLEDVLRNGETRSNGNTLSVFARTIEFSVRHDGFPLLTTKSVFFKGVVEELLWFLRGSSNTRELSNKGVHIWDGMSTRQFLDSVSLHHIATGYIGAGYGHQWRNFGGIIGDIEHGCCREGVDQLYNVITELSNNPHGRCAVLTSWNPQQLHEAVLPPGHMMYQFYIGKHGLSCKVTERSIDVYASLPFIIASVALLTTIIGTVIGEPVDRIIIEIGDAHLNSEYIEYAKEQITREVHHFPTIEIAKSFPCGHTKTSEKIEWIEGLSFDDFVIHKYNRATCTSCLCA